MNKYIEKTILSKYETILALENELAKTEHEANSRQQDIAKNLEKYKKEDILDLVNKEQFLNVNFKMNALVQDIAFKKTELYFYNKIALELDIEFEVSDTIEKLLLDIEKQFYIPSYALVEDNVELIDLKRKEEFMKSFTSEQINQEMERLMERYNSYTVEEKNA